MRIGFVGTGIGPADGEPSAGDRDHSAMVTTLEPLADHQVATVEKA